MILYDFFLFLYLVGIAPKLIWDWISKGKKHPGLFERLGISIPDSGGKPVLWLHAVSVGEVKSAAPLFQKLRNKYPHFFFLVTTTTATGQEEARRSLSEADAFSYLPVDFRWVVNRWVKKLSPTRFILVESDFWPNLLHSLKKAHTSIALVSGKLSERSAKRFRLFSPFAKRLFSYFDLLCVQNEEHKARFLSLALDSSRVCVAGNLKLDLEPKPIDKESWGRRLFLPENTPILTISCTHVTEEERILEALQGIPGLFFLAPRHPERFDEVAQILKKRGIPFTRWSERSTSVQKVLLVDAMGQLPICYSLSRLAILGGSFVEKIGGHNLLEPCLYGVPVFFGPYTFAQTELVARVLEARAGQQVFLEQLSSSVKAFFATPAQEKDMRAAALHMAQSGKGSTVRTFDALMIL